MTELAAGEATAARRARIGVGRAWLVVTGVLVAFWLVAPMLIVVPLSFTGQRSFQFPPPSWSTQWYQNFFSDPAWYRASVTSLQIAAAVAAVATVVGTAAAFGLVRGRFRAKSLVSALVISPMIVPVVITAIGIYAVFLRWHLTGSILGFILAHTVLAVPFVVVTVSTSLRAFEGELERASASLGAGPFATFRQVTLPLILPGVYAGALFAFITSFDELVIAIFLVDPHTRTLPVEMFTSVIRETDPTVAAASSVLIALTTSLLVLALLSRWHRGDGR